VGANGGRVEGGNCGIVEDEGAWYEAEVEAQLLEDRDGSFARGRGYPRIPDPMGVGTSSKICPRARVRAPKSACGQLTGGDFHPRKYLIPA
jgi:hypothetical protein